MCRLHTPIAEVARALPIVMRPGSFSAAEGGTGHKYETTERWLYRTAQHAQAITSVPIQEPHLTEVMVDALPPPFAKRRS